tara:strand:- start:310 stop:2280 length:1971 start_codon:yes stop_codon:yes gene_type:complete
MAVQRGLLGTSALVCVGLIMTGEASVAQDSGGTILDPISVISSIAKEETEVIDSEEITRRQPTTLNELFARSPDVSVSGANRTAAQKVYVRGLEETNLNVTVDGVKQNGRLYAHSGNMGLDPELLKRVEVNAGTGSALSGPGALGGVIRYETKDAEDMLLPGQSNGGMVKLSGQSNGKRLSPAIAAYGIAGDQFSYLFYGTKAWSEDYEDGSGSSVSDTGNEPFDGLAKLRFRPVEGHELEAIIDYREDTGARAYRSNFGVPETHPDSASENQEFIRRSTSLKYSFDPVENDLINLSTNIYDNKATLKRRVEDALTSNWLTRGGDIHNRSEIDNLTLTYGYDYTWEKSRGRSAAGTDASETGKTHGLYLQADYALTEQWLVSGGLRYDNSSLTDLAGNDYDGTHLSPNVRVRYEPLRGLGIFASWSEAFRGVRPVEGMTLLRPQGISGETDTSLDGEIARTTQIGFDINRDGWRAGLTGYTTTIEDSIQYWQGRSRPFSRTNGGDIDIVGFTASAGRDWRNWSADLSYAHSDIELDGQAVEPGDWLSGASPQGDKIGFALGYVWPEHNMQFNWNSTFVLSETELPEGYERTELPAYDVHDFSLTWSPNPAQQYVAAVTNIFDEHYLDQATPYSVTGGTTTLYEMGRSFRLSGRIKF